MTSMSAIDINPSILTYAHYHGISVSLDDIDPGSLLPEPLTPTTLSASLQDDDDLPSLDFDAVLDFISTELKEKITLSRASASLLFSIVRPSLTTFETDLQLCCPLSIHASRRFRVDVPALINDHEVDTMNFKRVSLEKLKIDLPLERVDVENDEGLAFPQRFWGKADEVRESAREARMQVTKDVIGLIQQVRRFGDRQRSDLWENSRRVTDAYIADKTKRRKALRRTITPPLLSREPTPECYLPGSPTLNMPIMSQPNTPVIPQCEQVKHRLAQDGIAVPPITMTTDGRTEDSLLQDSLLQSTSTPKVKGIERSVSSVLPMTRFERKRRAVELKVETPLTPPMSVKKRRHSGDVSAEVKCIIDQFHLDAYALPSHGGLKTQEPEKSLDEELVQLARNALEQVQCKLNHETLRSVPPNIKISVPTVTAINTVPPWFTDDDSVNDHQRAELTLLHMLKEASPLKPWPLTQRHKQLNWDWIRGEVVIAIDEKIPDNGSIRGLLMDADEDGLLDYTGLLYQSERGGLLGNAIRRYDREFTVSAFDLKKRGSATHPHKIQHGINTKKQCLSTAPNMHELDALIEGHVRKGNNYKRGNQTGKYQSVQPKSSSFQFSAGDSLASFMALRGKRSEMRTAPVSQRSIPSANNSGYQSDLQQQQLMSPEKKGILVPVPSVSRPSPSNTPLTLIISTALLKSHRRLIQKLETLTQPCHLIFRDYDEDQLQHSVQAPGEPSSSMQEADIILSPKTGIIISSVQETMQKYLPGHQPKYNYATALGNTQPSDSPLKTKVSMAAARYEELYIFICHTPGKTTVESSTPNANSGVTSEYESEMTKGTIMLDDQSHRALTLFSSFCAAFSPRVTVTPVLVSPTSAALLADWIVGLASKAHMNMPWSLGQDLPLRSTQYEMILRKAGLNVFAALFVLWWDGDKGQTKGGNMADRLARFLEMSAVERRTQYGGMLGERLLRRIERAIEMFPPKMICLN